MAVCYWPFSNQYTYKWQYPNYNYKCAGFTYYSSVDPEWFVMDDFGNAVRSFIQYDSE